MGSGTSTDLGISLTGGDFSTTGPAGVFAGGGGPVGAETACPVTGTDTGTVPPPDPAAAAGTVITMGPGTVLPADPIPVGPGTVPSPDPAAGAGTDPTGGPNTIITGAGVIGTAPVAPAPLFPVLLPTQEAEFPGLSQSRPTRPSGRSPGSRNQANQP